jgi:hypothetical protein
LQKYCIDIRDFRDRKEREERKMKIDAEIFHIQACLTGSDEINKSYSIPHPVIVAFGLQNFTKSGWCTVLEAG